MNSKNIVPSAGCAEAASGPGICLMFAFSSPIFSASLRHFHRWASWSSSCSCVLSLESGRTVCGQCFVVNAFNIPIVASAIYMKSFFGLSKPYFDLLYCARGLVVDEV